MDVGDPIVVLDRALGRDVIVGGAAVLGHVQRQPPALGVKPHQQVAQRLGHDRPTHHRPIQVGRQIVDEAGVLGHRGFTLAQI